ncbi:MAG: adenylate/guanylate cyclase domain-containing protein [Actinobacteria bacterium]|nr:adenylate/guanylate cyclase domain-containing protein [Actinomycetota bacterium]
MDRPDVRYVTSEGVNIAYQTYGAGPNDLVIVSGFISHLDLAWDNPKFREMMQTLSRFARVILFDKRGVGLSDPVPTAPTLEQRMQDVLAVLDAAESKKTVLFGLSEGAMMAALFAATYPERTQALVLYGGMARSTWAEDYPWGVPADELLRSNEELIAPFWGQGATIEMFSPSLADDPEAVKFYARLERQSASPQMAGQIYQMFLDLDIRDVLPSVHVPTLVMHRRGDRVVNVRAGRHLAQSIALSRYVEFEGTDHNMMGGDSTAILQELEEFVTGVRPAEVVDRILATVMFTDIVDSTRAAKTLGDSRFKELLGAHNDLVRQALSRHRGVEIKTTGDGFLATFDGPARAIRCGLELTVAVKSLGIDIRVGIHTGECDVIGDDVGGIAVHTASRICDVAAPGEVLVSRTVKDLVAGSGLAFEDRGSHAMKGLDEEWNLLAVKA